MEENVTRGDQGTSKQSLHLSHFFLLLALLLSSSLPSPDPEVAGEAFSLYRKREAINFSCSSRKFYMRKKTEAKRAEVR